MSVFILANGLNHNTSYKEYPEWLTYLAIVVVLFVIYLLLKGKIKNKNK